MIRALLIFVLFLMAPTCANADDMSMSIGAGKSILSSSSGVYFERSAAFGYQLVKSDFFIRPEIGWFSDVSGHGKSSFWFAPIVGIRALSSTGPELHIGVGPGYLQNPDGILGGHFQFSLEGGVGIDDGNTYLGIAWKHLSSSGLESPNQGRDFIVIQLRILNL